MSIVLRNVTKRYAQQVVIHNVTLDIADGEFFILLGSSGSGKTTILNIIAGLTSADQGLIHMHGRDVTNIPTQKRNVGFVFQNYALFQYMTVAENIEFGLKVRKVPNKTRQLKRDEMLDLVGLVGLGDRMPHQLSGGQQQRVALARALALEPDVLLLDEPLGALDAKIRGDLRRSLKAIQQQLGVTTILVTHDQEEAFDLADRIGVMSYGRLVEVGSPRDLYYHPKTEFVASFLGTANILLGQTEGNQIRIGPHNFDLSNDAAQFSENGRVQVVFRPEDLRLTETKTALECAPLGEGLVTNLGFSGPNERIRLELPAIPGVRAIAPAVPFGKQNIVIEASRSTDRAANFPLSIGEKAWVGIQRLHTLSHPGLSFLVVTDGSLRSQSAITLGGHLARMAHARIILLGVGDNEKHLETHVQEARKQIGSGMASVSVHTESSPTYSAISRSIEKDPVDLVIVGWRPLEGAGFAEQILQSGDHHLLLAAHPGTRIEKALVCAASGEPGKDDVMFAGRFLRHLGAQATLLTVIGQDNNNAHQCQHVEHFMDGGKHSLEMFGVTTQNELRTGDPEEEIVKEIQKGKYDLIILGTPLPNRDGRISLTGVVSNVIKNAGNCSLLLVRSHYHKNKFTIN